ncbi:hypothetical protein D3C86_2126540 [compost metagenome]
MRDKDLGIFQAHVDGDMGNTVPTPGGIFEDCHVDPALLEIIETTGDGGGHQHKLIVGL